jgi:hypothetical protein
VRMFEMKMLVRAGATQALSLIDVPARRED